MILLRTSISARLATVVWILALLALSQPTVSRAATPTAELNRSLESLRDGAEFERQQSELELRRMGEEILPAVARWFSATGPANGSEAAPNANDRLYRFRLERILLQELDRFLDRLDSEYRALSLDERELSALRELETQVNAFERYRKELEAAQKEDPDVAQKLDKLLALETLEKAMATAKAPTEAETARLDALRKQRAEWLAADPGAEGRWSPLLELARRLDPLAATRQLSELDRMRSSELAERVSERQPLVKKMRQELDSIGLIGYNRIIARYPHAAENLVEFYRELLTLGLTRFGEEIIGDDVPRETFDRVRYHQGLIWSWQAAAETETAKTPTELSPAARLVERHLTAVLADLRDPETIVEERAAEELFLLGRAGFKALKQELERAKASGADASRDDGSRGRGTERLSFLGHLLRWRVRPTTYAEFGIEFRDFPGLPFRERRRRVFDYARVARERAVPTLRAIVTDDDLEKSFFIKLAAAKALAGLRDLTGYSFLLEKHPDMTLKKPEVSRDLIVIQAYGMIRAKEYAKAVEELQRVLNEDPFDFAANYHAAFAYLLLRNYPKAIHHFDVARRIRPQDHLTLYNLACAYALAGDMLEKALDALTAAADAGFTDYQHIEKDPDLESLRGAARYRELIERLKQE